MAAEPESRRLTLRKGEKLRHRSLVEGLFRDGDSLYEFPLRLTFRRIDGEGLERNFRSFVPEGIDALQMLVTIPKKKRRHAVDRVLMRRRVREAYRLHRLPLKECMETMPGGGTLGLAFVYMHDKNLPYATIERKMKLLLKKVRERITPS